MNSELWILAHRFNELSCNQFGSAQGLLNALQEYERMAPTYSSILVKHCSGPSGYMVAQIVQNHNKCLQIFTETIHGLDHSTE